MKLNKLWILTALLYPIALTGCKNDDIYAADFDNKVYIQSDTKTSTILVKASLSDFTRTLQTASAKKLTAPVEITYKADPTLVEFYNRAYYDNAVALPEECYEMPQTDALLSANSSLSTPVDVNFKNLSVLDRDTHYVLPVVIDRAVGAEVLSSARAHYFVFKGAAIINVVADIEQNYLTVDWKNASALNNLSRFTIEGLLRVRKFDKMISTFLGIEDYFLLRFGDSNFPSGQLQVSCRLGTNFPAKDESKQIPLNQWVHIAVTFSNGDLNIYQNGELQSSGHIDINSVNLGSSEFYIGKSYNDDRFLSGDISEVRIWNTVRTQEQIAANPYYVDNASAGLVAYWKFDEGVGSRVKDYSVNGNDATAKTTPKWKPVALPESGK